MLFKEGQQFNKEFSATTAGLVFSDLLYLLQHQSFLQVQSQGFAHVFMIRLWRIAQQPADSL